MQAHPEKPLLLAEAPQSTCYLSLQTAMDTVQRGVVQPDQDSHTLRRDSRARIRLAIWLLRVLIGYFCTHYVVSAKLLVSWFGTPCYSVI